MKWVSAIVVVLAQQVGVEPSPTATSEPAPTPVEETVPVEQEVVVCTELRDGGQLLGASVTLFREGAESISGETGPGGCTTLGDVPAGTWSLTIEAPGVETREETLDVAGEAVRKEYLLVRRAKADDVIVVQGDRETDGGTRRTIDSDTLKVLPGSQGDALKGILNLPGLARPPVILGALLVRGAAPEDTAVFIDGQEVPQLYHFGGLTSIIATETITSLDFLPGGFGVRYGGATGGVVDVRTKDGSFEKWGGSVDADLYDSAVVAEGPLGEEGKNGSLVGAVRRSYVDFVLANALPEGAINFTVAPRYYDYQLRYTAPPLSGGSNAYVFAFGSDDKLTFVLDEPVGPSGRARGTFLLHTLFHRVQGGWSTVSGDWLFSVEPGVGYTRTVVDAGEFFALNVNVYDAVLRAEARGAVSSNVRLLFGIQAGVAPVDVTVEVSGESDGDSPLLGRVDETWGGGAAYAEAQIQLIRGFTLIPGVRVDGFFPQGKVSFDPRLAMRYAPTDKWFAKAYAGVYHQPPEPQEWNSSLGNPDLVPPVAYHFGLGGGLRVGFGTTIEAEGFYKWLDDLVVQVPTDPTNPAVQIGFANDGIGRVYGGELLVRRELTKDLYGWIAYTLSRSERANPYTPGAFIPFAFDQTHILTIVAGYKLPRGWEVGARFRYATGNPTTEALGSIYDADRDEYIPIFGAINAARIPDFHQFDVRVDKRWEFNRWKLGIYLDVQNAYNRANPEGVNYDYDYENANYFTGIPLFPSIGIRGEF